MSLSLDLFSVHTGRRSQRFAIIFLACASTSKFHNVPEQGEHWKSSGLVMAELASRMADGLCTPYGFEFVMTLAVEKDPSTYQDVMRQSDWRRQVGATVLGSNH